MVVYVFGTGCQIVVENDHKLGCAASVEHTPHPLGRASSCQYFFNAILMRRASEASFFFYGTNLLEYYHEARKESERFFPWFSKGKKASS